MEHIALYTMNIVYGRLSNKCSNRFALLALISLFACTSAFSKCEILREDSVEERVGNHPAALIHLEIKKSKKLQANSNLINHKSARLIATQNKYIELYNLGYRSESTHQRLKKSLEWWIRSINKGAARVDKNLGIKELHDKYNKYKRYPASLAEEFRGLAKQDNIEALYCLGVLYEQGIGVEMSKVRAWAWYNAAFAVDGIYARKQQDRVWALLDWQEQVEAQKLSEEYIKEYTNIPKTPSVIILR